MHSSIDDMCLAYEVQALRRKRLVNRGIHALLAACGVFVFGFSFALFGWTAAHMDPPLTSKNFPVAPEIWTLSMTMVAIICLISAGYCMFRLLDEITYPQNSRQRITGARR